jgi:multidrug resistance protein, MATE family
MSQSHDNRTEIQAMASLAAPIVLAELGWMAMGVVDTMFVGRVSAEAIGAVGLGTAIFYGVAISASGLMLGLDTLVARSWGAGDHEDCRHTLISALWALVILMLPVMGLVLAFLPLLAGIGIDPGVLRETRPYLITLTWSAPPLMLYFAFRRYLQAIGQERIVTVALVLANIINLAGNWLFVAGNMGAPKLGAEGAAWATFASRLFMAILLGVWISRDRNFFHGGSWTPDWQRMGRLLKLGLSSAGQIAVEVSVFGTVTILVSKTTPAALAGHQIVLTIVSSTFMVPLGISSAAAVRVGHALGRKDPAGAARAGWMALALGATVMGTFGLILLAFPYAVARLFTPETEILATAAVLLRISAFFQLFDGLQVVSTGALRALGDTRTPMLCHFTGYWIIGLPLGAYLCFGRGMAAAGLWTGLSLGLILIGTALPLVWKRAVGHAPA